MKATLISSLIDSAGLRCRRCRRCDSSDSIRTTKYVIHAGGLGTQSPSNEPSKVPALPHHLLCRSAIGMIPIVLRWVHFRRIASANRWKTCRKGTETEIIYRQQNMVSEIHFVGIALAEPQTFHHHNLFCSRVSLWFDSRRYNCHFEITLPKPAGSVQLQMNVWFAKPKSQASTFLM